MTTRQLFSVLTATLQADRSRNARRGPDQTPHPASEASRHEDRGPVGGASITQHLNWLRAGVLGANDGVVSITGLLVGVAAADPGNTSAIDIAGTAGILSAALSMAVGEFDAGSALPFLTLLAFAPNMRIPASIGAVLAALAITGWVSA